MISTGAERKAAGALNMTANPNARSTALAVRLISSIIGLPDDVLNEVGQSYVSLHFLEYIDACYRLGPQIQLLG
jgi:hypothetical protein